MHTIDKNFSPPLLGCIADDVTGATDLATNLVQGGMKVVQVFGLNGLKRLSGSLAADAVVVAQKTRSIAAASAVEQSCLALQALQESGVRRFYFKYCSTFDSTPAGNIGPVSEALMTELGVGQTIYCPAFPKAGRTVYNGHLFVGETLLAESSLKDHPLNPMTDSSLVRFLGHQVSGKVGLIPAATVNHGASMIQAALHSLSDEGIRHAVIDTCHEEHLKSIAEVASNMLLVTGGSGLARYLPSEYRARDLLDEAAAGTNVPVTCGRSAVIAGSCSVATSDQVRHAESTMPVWKVDVAAVCVDVASEVAAFRTWMDQQGSDCCVLVTSTASADEVAAFQQTLGVEASAAAIEDFLAQAALVLVREFHVRQLVVAGGETSGAVTKSLGVEAVEIGPEICVGVPWTITIDRDEPLALALKSGNFGESDFFTAALEMLA